MNEPTAANLAVELTRRAVESARPDAPVVPDRPRPARVASARLRVAGSLHSVARWVEPRPAKVCQPG
ncbi:hypothetical protein [Nocardioides halotolerans]|jgi:hypothetical protein|uniref:hypothetical protein n=1 Tax=Nocardioides halotolerans TaxID=433660 RepID=UPI000414DFD2|nr:hypothetical protein [Nocardioides halotolerans]